MSQLFFRGEEVSFTFYFPVAPRSFCASFYRGKGSVNRAQKQFSGEPFQEKTLEGRMRKSISMFPKKYLNVFEKPFPSFSKNFVKILRTENQGFRERRNLLCRSRSVSGSKGVRSERPDESTWICTMWSDVGRDAAIIFLPYFPPVCRYPVFFHIFVYPNLLMK